MSHLKRHLKPIILLTKHSPAGAGRNKLWAWCILGVFFRPFLSSGDLLFELINCKQISKPAPFAYEGFQKRGT